jgi:hypothetical protein
MAVLPALWIVLLGAGGCDTVPCPSGCGVDGSSDEDAGMLARAEPLAPGAAAVEARSTALPASGAAEPRAEPGEAHSCRLGRPPGDCDRCPEHACRQVRLSFYGPPSEAPWVPFCAAGDLREEAFIACSCGGGSRELCVASSLDVVHAMDSLDRFFGGSVPPVGTPYFDASGLPARVDRDLHDWLALVSSPPPTARCDPPDVDAAERRYLELAQRVRTTGSCAP